MPERAGYPHRGWRAKTSAQAQGAEARPCGPGCRSAQAPGNHGTGHAGETGMNASRTLMLAAVLAAGACGGGPSDPGLGTGTNPPPTDPPVLERTVVLQGLSSPWGIAVAADGALFFTRRCRGLPVRRPDGSVTRLFGTSGSALVASDLQCVGQSGVHGVALDPAFATNRTVYVYMLSNLNTSPRTNRVVKLVLNAGYTSAGSRTDIIT